MLTPEKAINLAKELKIDRFTIYREWLQILFLKHLSLQKESRNVYFKGGTAIRFLLGSFRFSEDLDFNSLLDKPETERLVHNTITSLLKEENVKFRKERAFEDSFVERIYQNISGFSFPLTIRIDISLREKTFGKDCNYIETIFPIGPYPYICHLKKEEILAEKVRALMVRRKGRDIFDIWFLLGKGVNIDISLINKKMALYKRKINIQDIISTIERIQEKEIKRDLTKFLPISHRGITKKIKSLLIEKLKNME